MRRTRRLLLLPAAASLLMACPALLEDDFEAVDGSAGGASREQPAAGAGAQAGASSAGEVGDTRGEEPSPGGAESGGQPLAGATTTGGAVASGGDSGAGGTTGGAGGSPEGGGTGGNDPGGAGGTSGAQSGGAESGGVQTGGASGARSGGSEPGGAGSGGASGAQTGGSNGGEGGATGGSSGGSGASGGEGGAICASSPVDCEALRSALVHRYRFEGTGTTVTASVGGADGPVMGGATLGGDGALTLVGGSVFQPDYVDLPNGIVSALADATFETWLVWNGGAPWQPVFDFGDAMSPSCTYGGASALEGQPGACGRTYLYLLMSTDADEGSVLRTAFMKQPGEHPDDRIALDGPRAPTQVELHLAVVVDDTLNRIQLYVDGAPRGTLAFPDHLSDLNDKNNWLGRSQFADDAARGFDGTYLEFRIYDAALSAAELATSYAEGPDPAFLE